MLNFFANFFAGLGLLNAGASEGGCVHLIIDEPEMPKSMIK